MLAAQSPARWPLSARIRLGSMAVRGALALAFCLPATAQQTPPAQPGTTPPEASQQPAPDATQNPTPSPTAATGTPTAPLPGEITEDQLKHMLLGKQLFLRGGYMDNDLNFNELGALIGHSPQGSFTLNEVQIERVRLTKHKVELEGTRYGLHFLGALAYEDNSTAFETLRITPKKKVLKITIDREQVLVRKAKKETSAKGKGQKAKPAPPVSPTAPQPAPATASATASQTPPAATEPSDADQLKAQIAAAPAAERPADPASVTATDSPLHAANLLRGAIDRIFSVGIDDRLKASMPDCWKLYYQAVAEKADYSPKDPAVLRQNAADKKAKLLSVFQPDSNEYAQADAVSGMALYHTVIGPDGKPREIAVGRPIGFGLDENAVASIRKASFEPAIKDGKPVPVLLDLVVEFHIYSKRTAATTKPDDATKPAEPSLPGPYSLQHP
jgi:outer membrane biosynthesis protein TonB